VDSYKVFTMPKKAAKTQEVPRMAGNARALTASSERNSVRNKANPKNVPVRTDSAALEEQTISRVERTVRALGDFLARWDSSESKPDSMFPEVVKIRKFHDLLSEWQKDALSARGKGDEKSRLKRLRDFVVLCKMYS
jgi:hypothetical protein